MFKKLDWDSEFFGMKVGKLDIEDATPNIGEIEQELKRNNFDLLYLFAPSESEINRQLKSKYKEDYIEDKIVFEKSIEEIGSFDGITEYLEDKVSEDLLSLSYQSGVYSRFNVDSKIDEERFKLLYRLWIEGSVSNKLADKVFVYQEDGRELGMVTVKIKDGNGEIGLVSVDSTQRGKGVGSRLLNRVFYYLKEKNIGTITVPTQMKNKEACSFYEKNGFSLKTKTSTYHFHKQ